MGYYSEFNFKISPETIIDREKKVKFEKKFSDISNNKVCGFQNVKFDCSDNNELKNVTLDEGFAKFYDDKYFAEETAKIIISGIIRIFFCGEDCEEWGYKITPQKVEKLQVVKFFLTTEEYAKYSVRSMQNILGSLKK